MKDASAEIVVARSRDFLSWSSPETSSPTDAKQEHMDLLPFLFADSSGRSFYLSWTSSRTGRNGDILLRGPADGSGTYRRLTTEDKRDYDAKFAAAGEPGRYLMVWVSNRVEKTGIYARFVRP